MRARAPCAAGQTPVTWGGSAAAAHTAALAVVVLRPSGSGEGTSLWRNLARCDAASGGGGGGGGGGDGGDSDSSIAKGQAPECFCPHGFFGP